MKSPRFLVLYLSAALLVAVGCTKTLPTQQPVPVSPLALGTGEWRVVDHVAVITDASGTMYINETFPEAKALTESFVAGMPAASEPSRSGTGYRAGSVGFGGNDRIAAPVASFNRGNLASKAQSLHIMGDVHNMGGTTPLDKVLMEIRQELGGSRGGAAVVVFSDGVPDRPELALWSAYQLAVSVPDGICFHTVQTGDDPSGKVFLTNLSQITSCGSYRAGRSIDNPTAFTNFERAVFAGAAPTLPAVAAGPCEGPVGLSVEFEFDSAKIHGSSVSTLEGAARDLERCPNVSIEIGGYTDSIGSESYNEGLSQRRANSVKQFFERNGVGAGRLSARGYGEADPVDSNDTSAGRARNRRVELQPR